LDYFLAGRSTDELQKLKYSRARASLATAAFGVVIGDVLFVIDPSKVSVAVVIGGTTLMTIGLQYLRRDPGERDRARRCHELVSPTLRLSIVSLYLIAGAAFSFFTVGIMHVGLHIGISLMQFLALGAAVSIGLVHILRA
jgi:hypothetical protein